MAVRILSKVSVSEDDLKNAEYLIEKFFETFIENLGVDAQSFNFHMMRHLVDQVRKIGPLWLFSAFSFESAHRELLTGVCGTIKKPEKMLERFLMRQIIRTDTQSFKFFGAKYSQKPQCNKFCKISENCSAFLQNVQPEKVFSRYSNKAGELFCSLAYSKLGDNMSECIVNVNDGFFLIECFYELSGRYFALGRSFELVSELNFFGSQKAYALFYEIASPGNLKVVHVNCLLYKCLVLRHIKSSMRFRVSVMREGFEHN